MGTNYYLHVNVCKECGKPEEVMHIGKSSFGWCFSLHVTDQIRSLDEWIKLIDDLGSKAVIKNEYGDIQTKDQLLSVITDREDYVANCSSDNYSKYKGLYRHDIGLFHCIGHGEGPWDLITGEFS